MENIFIKSNSPDRRIRKELIKIRGHQCEQCKNTIWQNQPITLQVHHIDGDPTNNILQNLQLLCPNCHSLTENFGAKNRKHSEPVTNEELIEALKNNTSIRQALLAVNLADAGVNYEKARHILNNNNIKIGENLSLETKIKENYCPICNKAILPTSKYCSDCAKIKSRTVERPDRETLKKLIRTKTFVQLGKDYGVSDSAIKKWCKYENLPATRKEINTYSDEDWNNI